MGDPGRVTGWLKGLRIEDDEGEKDAVNHQLEQKERVVPVTPPRRGNVYQQVEEIFPTDTSFSSGSIFDTPCRLDYELETPYAPRTFRDDESDITSLDQDDRDWDSEKNTPADRLQQPLFASHDLSSASLNSFNPSCSGTSIDPNSVLSPIRSPTPPPHNSNTPRIVTVLSCLQCTHANLPCSRTTPSCTRCIRNSMSKSCLLLRRRFPEEIDPSKPQHCTVPVMLERKAEDENEWARKMKVMQTMREVWQHREDKRNWVLPRVDSEVRVDWRVEGRVDWVEEKWLSEGLGRVVFEEVVVDAFEQGVGIRI
ncbi:hypothetical protein EK21DRAFT_117759 [Setomelanomma holmii]|uniref:Zn(2)-C6 fungal-type domain-containing protein n=1 Tax=Setomelanomma holmii TaxID=210430 RepID=A0A9P4H0E3_9PLEO|nr:hypothetical protein EK21DRAFT_117759 [Setomelanomma holmii]